MGDIIKVDVNVNVGAINAKVDQLVDDTTMLAIHNLLAKMCDPYVPMDEGVLAQTTEITPEYVRYNVPYAHYMYIGEIYGPNIPVKDEAGNIIRWFSPPGQKKTPTGRDMVYGTEKHPLASKEWDKAMMRDRRDEFIEQVRNILVRKANELYR